MSYNGTKKQKLRHVLEDALPRDTELDKEGKALEGGMEEGHTRQSLRPGTLEATQGFENREINKVGPRLSGLLAAVLEVTTWGQQGGLQCWKLPHEGSKEACRVGPTGILGTT